MVLISRRGKNLDINVNVYYTNGNDNDYHLKTGR
jgi:hypothetical protein